MALSRTYWPSCSGWEVDYSGLAVYPVRTSQPSWEVLTSSPGGWEYLLRHGLLLTHFSSRARAVDAVRLALQAEPRISHPETRWCRSDPGRLLSRDGHWRLTRMGRDRWALSPQSQPARRGVSHHARVERMLSPQRATLRMMAAQADQLSQMLALPGGRAG